MSAERKLDLGKGKGKQPIQIGGNQPSPRPQKEKIQKPPPTTIITDTNRKWHQTRRPIK